MNVNNLSNHTQVGGLNMQTKRIANKFVQDFCNLFTFVPSGNLNVPIEKLHEIEEWYNNNSLMISLLTGIQCDFIMFKSSMPEEDKNKNIMYIYTVSYTAALQISSRLGISLPEKYLSIKESSL